MTTLFVNRLTVIDCSYLSPARGLVGESWQVDIELDGDLDYQGMVLDFGEIKRSIKRLIDSHFDHKLLVPAEYEGLHLQDTQGVTGLTFTLDDGRVIEHRSPRDALRLLPCQRITTDRLAQTVGDYLSPHTPDNVTAVRVRLWPEMTGDAHYHYSHGLKHHDGNCQRIAHGHRSRIVIERNGARDPVLEQAWAERWTDVYIGTRDDLAGEHTYEGVAYLAFAYHASQGDFRLSLPRACCYLIDGDSTVENIAQHIADRLKAEHPADRFTVYAYEGVDKGAVGRA
jgi:6-pyruvoyl-tetrahydropterin synthase